MEPRGIVKAFRKVKRAQDVPPETDGVSQKKAKPDEVSKEAGLSGLTAYIVQAGIGKARTEIFRKQIVQNGGDVNLAFCPAITHVIIDDGMDCERAFRLLKLKVLPPNVQLVRSTWLSLCIAEKRVLSTAGYSVFIPDRYLQPEQRVKTQGSGGEGQPEATEISCQSMTMPKARLNCTEAEKTIVEQLRETTPEENSETGQASAAQEACKIPGIGKSMAEKIREILQSGHLRKLDYINESVPVLETFSNIWGAGVKTAQMWYQQGFRTLDDIHTKASLTKQQTIGLKHYHDFLDRMPRDEAAEIEKTVSDMAHSINPTLIALACGSYRRGKPTCGDVDVLITHPDGKSHIGVFTKILAGLRDTGFLTDDLVCREDIGNQKKYLGVCRLPGPGHRHRRLDIIVVPYSEFACALMYFTGSAHFNRSMRALAKTKGMSLSEHTLNCHVLRKGSAKISTGVPISTITEQDIFQQLGLPYREPCERDW
ncbi:DNA polymerase lambda isoform X2 [Scyliorhinus canicula]|uniref:DNA polymerase lambda isoform X2 n=1 Tax=Scyliorhinus canicula TaxID=7830 RepID=UPI0018F3E5C0|nr:DNA polymerase lambda isoform X2 [Scyliorhinus canicula]